MYTSFMQFIHSWHNLYTIYTQLIHTLYTPYTHLIHDIYTIHTHYIHNLYTTYTQYIQNLRVKVHFSQVRCRYPISGIKKKEKKKKNFLKQARESSI